MTSRRKDVRIRRSIADRMVKELQERILEINSDDRYAYKVGRAVIFGSYVNSDCDTLGDIDVGYLLEKRFSDRARHESLVESIRRQGAYSGALGVDFREFTHLYEFINNMAIRYEQNLQLIMITIEPYSSTKGEFSPEILENAMTHMNTAIRGSLRSVDVCTRFSNQQFLVILTNAELQNIEMIIKRIFEQFYKLCDNKNLHLHYEAADLKDT